MEVSLKVKSNGPQWNKIYFFTLQQHYHYINVEQHQVSVAISELTFSKIYEFGSMKVIL